MIKSESGFIALLSAIIISVVLLIVAFSGSMAGIWSRINILDSESKEKSFHPAEGCGDVAILSLMQGIAVPDDSIINIGAEQCTITNITADAGTGLTTIKTGAQVNKAHTNLKIIIDSDEYSLVSSEEVINF